MVLETDAVDERILSVLQTDARITIRDLAKKLKIHPNTAIQRIKKLEDAGIIVRYGAEIDYSKLGYSLQVICRLKVRCGHVGSDSQLEFLTKIKEVEAVYAVTGACDVFVLCRAKDQTHFVEILRQINNNPMVVGSESSVILYSYKTPSQFDLFASAGK